jgi:hypothetical protein
MRFLGVVLALLPFTNGLYFHMREGEKRCFIEEVPEDTVVLGMSSLNVCTPSSFAFPGCNMFWPCCLLLHVNIIVYTFAWAKRLFMCMCPG